MIQDLYHSNSNSMLTIKKNSIPIIIYNVADNIKTAYLQSFTMETCALLHVKANVFACSLIQSVQICRDELESYLEHLEKIKMGGGGY